MKVGVIGGGISGLVTAYRLKNAGIDVRVFEASASAGGNIQTERRDGFLFEYGPNSFLSTRELADLISGLGLAGEVVAPRPDARRRYIVRDGHIAELPSGPGSIITSPAFSARGKAKLLAEPIVRSKSDGDETVFDFFNRRFGREIAEYALDPFISGIYAGNPHKLSIRTAFPRIYEYERRYGSVIRGALFSPKDKAAQLPKGWPRSFTLKGGSHRLIEALSKKLGDSLLLGAAVLNVSKGPNGYSTETESGAEQFNAVVVATPAHPAAKLVAGLDAKLERELAGVYYPPIAVVFTAFRTDQVTKYPSGFGMLVPSVEKRPILGILFNSSAFEHRCPPGMHLFTTFIGGSRDGSYVEKPEEELIGIAAEEMHQLLGVRGEPIVASVKKWPRSIPQYNVGYETVTEAVERFERENPGAFVCSNFHKGISVGDCVKNAVSTSERILNYLNHSK